MVNSHLTHLTSSYVKHGILFTSTIAFVLLIISSTYSAYYEAEGGVIELPETGAPYAPHVKAKIT